MKAENEFSSLIVKKNSNFENFGLTVHNGGKNKNKSYYKITREEYIVDDSHNSYFDATSTRSIDNSNKFLKVENEYNSKADVTQDSRLNNLNNGGGGGGNGMEKRIENLERKTENIQIELQNATRSLAVLEESQKNNATKMDIGNLKSEILSAINLLPKEDNIKQIILKTNNESKLASEDFVEKEITKFSNTQIKWLIGTALTTCGVVSALVFGILKIVS